MRKSAAYWEGRREETERLTRNGRSPSVADLAQQVALAIGRDEARKRVIVGRSPGIFASMDGNELGEASSVELALRELKALGIDPGDNDPLAILDAHHAGRQWARGSKGSATDASEGSPLADKLSKHYGI